MVFRRDPKVEAFKARLQMDEAERRLLVEIVTKSQVNLAKIAERMDRVQQDIRVISNELKLLEMSKVVE